MTHSVDMDGMASAALLVRNLGMPVENTIFINYGGETFEHAMSSLSKIEGSGNILVISDFCLTDLLIKRMEGELQSFRKKGNRILWIDHHPWSTKALRSAKRYCDLLIVGENPYFCGAELVYRLLCKKDKFCDELTRITHLSDFWLRSKSKRDNDLVDKIAFGLKQLRSGSGRDTALRDFVSELAAGNIDCKIINDAYSKYERKTRPILVEMLSSCSVIRVSGIKIGIGFGTVLAAQEACMAIIERKRCDVGIYIDSKSLHGSIRSVRDEQTWGVDILELAESISGGGHALAAGFSFEGSGHQTDTMEGRRALVDEIRRNAERIYSKRIKYFQQSTGKEKIRRLQRSR